MYTLVILWGSHSSHLTDPVAWQTRPRLPVTLETKLPACALETGRGTVIDALRPGAAQCHCSECVKMGCPGLYARTNHEPVTPETGEAVRCHHEQSWGALTLQQLPRETHLTPGPSSPRRSSARLRPLAIGLTCGRRVVHPAHIVF